MGILLTIAIVLLVLWMLGIVSLGPLAWFIHILLVIAVILILLSVIREA